MDIYRSCGIILSAPKFPQSPFGSRDIGAAVAVWKLEKKLGDLAPLGREFLQHLFDTGDLEAYVIDAVPLAGFRGRDAVLGALSPDIEEALPEFHLQVMKPAQLPVPGDLATQKFGIPFGGPAGVLAKKMNVEIVSDDGHGRFLFYLS